MKKIYKKKKFYKTFTKKSYSKKKKWTRSVLGKPATTTLHNVFPVYMIATGNTTPASFGTQKIAGYSLAPGAVYVTNTMIYQNIGVAVGDAGYNLQFNRALSLYSMVRIKSVKIRYQSDLNWNARTDIIAAGPLSISVRPAFGPNTHQQIEANFTYSNNLFVNPVNLKISKSKTYKMPARAIQNVGGLADVNSWMANTVVEFSATPLYLVIGQGEQFDSVTAANNTENHTLYASASTINVTCIGSIYVSTKLEYSVPQAQ